MESGWLTHDSLCCKLKFNRQWTLIYTFTEKMVTLCLMYICRCCLLKSDGSVCVFVVSMEVVIHRWLLSDFSVWLLSGGDARHVVLQKWSHKLNNSLENKQITSHGLKPWDFKRLKNKQTHFRHLHPCLCSSVKCNSLKADFLQKFLL